MSIEWLPIEINVPDTIGSIVSNFQNTAGNIIQRIPFINRFVSPEEPRPLPYIVLVPLKQGYQVMPEEPQDDGSIKNVEYFSPFGVSASRFPMYP